MDKYDPLSAPNPEQWLALDDAERTRLVLDYHRRTQFHLPDPEPHAMMHVIVENQIALGDETPVRWTAQRLIVEGLDRHEVIHAIASVLIGHFAAIMKTAGSSGRHRDPNQDYYDALEQLSAESWLASG